jgi:hypothetical protein
MVYLGWIPVVVRKARAVGQFPDSYVPANLVPRVDRQIAELSLLLQTKWSFAFFVRNAKVN